jgi:hypothetical protein
MGKVIGFTESQIKKISKKSPFGPVQSGMVGRQFKTTSPETPDFRQHADEAISLGNSGKFPTPDAK